MHDPQSSNRCDCTALPRRAFLADMGMGFTGLALGSMLLRDGVARANEGRWSPRDGQPHFPPKAKSVIWIFFIGGMSQVESFDPKPELNKYAGKTIAETPYKATLDSPLLKKNLREVIVGIHKVHPTVFPMQIGYKKRGESGLEISDWFPHLGGCADDIALIRSMWTTDNNHGAQMQFHTGRHSLEGVFPTIGSWVHYGLGSLNDDLPEFIVIGSLDECCGGKESSGADYLGPAHRGVGLKIDPKNPLPFASPGAAMSAAEQREAFGLLNEFHGLAKAEYPSDPALLARIKSYELAFRMQTAIPELVRFNDETAATQKMYGLENPQTREFGQHCLAARRMVERGVRFVQIFHGNNGSAGHWDAHSDLKAGHTRQCGQVDQPLAALIKDLKQRGLLDETLLVVGTEFGRTPGAQGGTGRDHHPYGFSVMMAGGGLRGGVAHGATDELGFHAVENRHYVTDIHATVLHQLGIDPRRLEVPGRKRLEIDYGKPIHEIIA